MQDSIIMIIAIATGILICLTKIMRLELALLITSFFMIVFAIIKDSKNREFQEKLKARTAYLSAKAKEIELYQKDLESCKETIAIMNKEIMIQTVDISPYENIASEECKSKLALLKIREKQLIKSDKAIIVYGFEESAVDDKAKQILKCFMSECKSIIDNVSIKNIDSARSKIEKSFDLFNKLFEVSEIILSYDLLELKYEELSLVYACQLKKEQEREQQRFIKEKMLEEEKLRKEIERQKQKIEKEETQFRNEIDKLMQYMQQSNDEIQSQLYMNKIKELEEKLKLLEKDKANVLEREQNTRAGFVYIISNIGSFGENVYKIGMTRRLEPMDRIKELGDASVPFKFDVHAIIFSEDAPALENILHETFREFEVNKINHRKEFFNISLDKIKKVVTDNYNATVKFIDIPEAEEYRQSNHIEKN